MENFEIIHKGEKLSVVKSPKNGYFVKMPIRYGDNNSKFSESISRDKDGWLFSSRIEDDPEYFFAAWLKDDGTMSYTNDLLSRVVECEDKFNPNSSNNAGSLNDVYQTIYSVVKQIYDYERVGRPVSDIINLRRKRLETTLKLLGYNNGEVSDSSYLALGRIGHQVENYRNLAAYVRSKGFVDGVEQFEMDFPADMSRDEIQAMINEEEKRLAEDLSFIEVQDEERGYQRSLMEDFCTGMSRKLPQDEWERYSKIVKKTAEFYIRLNADIYPAQDGEEIVDHTGLTGSDLEDEKSSLIDSSDFSKACNAEDRFFAREANRFSEQIDVMIDDSDRVRQSSVGTRLEALRRQVLATRDKRMEYDAKYVEMQNYLNRKVPIKREEERDGKLPND